MLLLKESTPDAFFVTSLVKQFCAVISWEKKSKDQALVQHGLPRVSNEFLHEIGRLQGNDLEREIPSWFYISNGK